MEMTILIDVNLGCNLNCEYCYNQILRKEAPRRDLDKLREIILEISERDLSNEASLHGGETLIMPKDELEEILSLCYRSFESVNIQTNGTQLDDPEIIDLLKKYDVTLGVSIDGPSHLNRLRADKDTTKNILNNIRNLANDFRLGIITIASKANALPKYRETFKKFILEIHELGTTGRINPARFPEEKIQLTIPEAKEFYLDIFNFMKDRGISKWSPFQDLINGIRGCGEKMCTFSICDPYSTSGGITITADGRVSMCQRFTSDYLENDLAFSDIRDRILSRTDCQGCEFFSACHGGCSANARDFDWRNKTRWCPVWKALMSEMKEDLGFYNIPLNQEKSSPDERPYGDVPHGDDHGDHWDNV